MANTTDTDTMTWKSYWTMIVVIIMFIALCFERQPAWLLILIANVLLWVTTVLTTKDALAGFSSPGLITVVALFVVVRTVSNSETLIKINKWILGDANHPRLALLKQIIAIFIISTFINNTPVVALFMPIIKDWARDNNIAPSLYLLPLSYSSIMGGLNSVVGTSTNLVVQAFLQDPKSTVRPMEFFEIGYIGFPIGVISIIFMVTFGYALLPKDRGGMFRLAKEHGSEFLSQIKIPQQSKLIGQNIIEWFKKSELTPITLLRINNASSEATEETRIIVDDYHKVFPISEEITFQPDDRIVVKASSQTIIQHIQQPATNSLVIEQHYISELLEECYEIVFSHHNNLIGKPILSEEVQKHYNFAVLAARKSNHDYTSLDNINIEPGLTVLVLANKEFLTNFQHTHDFYVMSTIKGAIKKTKRNLLKEYFSIAIIVAMFAVGGSNIVDLDVASVVAACLVVLFNLVSPQDAIDAVDWSLVIMIGASLGLGKAMETSGLANQIGILFKGIDANINVIFLIYNIFGIISTEIISNNASAAIMYPIGISIAQALSVNPYPFVISSAVCASAGFVIPFGYQTHLIVYGPGGYKISDFVKVGLPMDLIYCVGLTVLAPLIWPF